MSGSDLTINYWILGDEYERTYSVEIPSNKNVNALKEAIKAKGLITLKDTEAPALILCNVSIPYSSQLAEHAAALDLDKLKLNPLDKLSKVFANGLLDDTHVHVVVKIPQASGAWVYVGLSSLR
jgi:Crinkler effector protein N-terminal domain